MSRADSKGKNVLDPRQALVIQYYSDAQSETFSNAYQSLRKAGYSHSIACDPQRLSWLQAHRASYDVNLIKKAEKNLDKIASINIKLSGAGVKKIDVEIAKLQVDVSKFVLDRLAKSKYGKTDDAKMPEITVNIIQPKVPSATRAIEPETRDAEIE